MGQYKILCFPSIYSDRGRHFENQARPCVWDHDYSLVEHTVLVFNDGLTSPGFPCKSSTKYHLPFNQDQKHSLYPKTKLLAVHLSVHPSDIQTFHQKLQILSWSRGNQPQGQDMSLYSEIAQLYDIKERESLFSRWNCCIGIFT